MRWLFLFLLFTSISERMLPSVQAESQIVFKYGFEKNIIKEGIGSGERLYGLEYIYPIGSFTKLKLDGGVWIARRPGRKTAFYLSPSWGYRILPFKGIYVESYIGAGVISGIDSELGGLFQVFHDVNFGFIQDEWSLGLGFKHISSAGIYTPNKGRDFLSVRFMVAF